MCSLAAHRHSIITEAFVLQETNQRKQTRTQTMHKALWGTSHPEITFEAAAVYRNERASVTALDVCDPNLHQHPFHRRYKAHFFECYFAASWQLLPASKNPSESCGTLLPEGVGQFVPRWLCSSR